MNVERGDHSCPKKDVATRNPFISSTILISSFIFASRSLHCTLADQIHLIPLAHGATRAQWASCSAHLMALFASLTNALCGLSSIAIAGCGINAVSNLSRKPRWTVAAAADARSSGAVTAAAVRRSPTFLRSCCAAGRTRRPPSSASDSPDRHVFGRAIVLQGPLGMGSVITAGYMALKSK